MRRVVVFPLVPRGLLPAGGAVARETMSPNRRSSAGEDQ